MDRPTSGLSLSSVVVVDKDQDSWSGIWVSTALVPRMKMKLQELKQCYTLQYIIFNGNLFHNVSEESGGTKTK